MTRQGDVSRYETIQDESDQIPFSLSRCYERTNALMLKIESIQKPEEAMKNNHHEQIHDIKKNQRPY